MFKRMGGGVKGFLNNVQKNCTFLSWRLPLLFFVLITITIVDCFLWMPSDHIVNLTPVRSGRRWQLSCCQPLGICHFYSRSNTNFSNNKKSRRDEFVNVKDKTRMICIPSGIWKVFSQILTRNYIFCQRFRPTLWKTGLKVEISWGWM